MTISALYKTHCKTFSIAKELLGYGKHDCVVTKGEHAFHGFRCFPEYRTKAGKKLRQGVYNHIVLIGRKNI